MRSRGFEERFRSLFDNHPDALFAVDTGGGIARANAAVQPILGFPPEDLVGRTLSDVVGTADLPLCLATFNRALSGLAGGVDLDVRHAKGESASRRTSRWSRSPVVTTSSASTFRSAISARGWRPRIKPQQHAEQYPRSLPERGAANENAERQIGATFGSRLSHLRLGSGALYEAASDRIVHAVGDPIPLALARSILDADQPLARESLPTAEQPERNVVRGAARDADRRRRNALREPLLRRRPVARHTRSTKSIAIWSS